MSSEFAERWMAGRPFPLDDFQRAAVGKVDDGHSVVVSAPTGAGKTVVGEFACAHALTNGARAFYTAPIKALSNQKFSEFREEFGVDAVGLLTGDNSINSSAPIVVMTTEVLRNMLYEGSRELAELRWVILDEVHYLQDRFRGAVWEEVLIHLPPTVGVVCLSATVSNIEEFADWISTVRGGAEVISHDVRPVPLNSMVCVGTQLTPLVKTGGGITDGASKRWTNGQAKAVMERSARSRKGRRPPRMAGPVPTKVEVIRTLEERSMLPAIFFVFSRAGCDAGVERCLHAGLDLNDASSAARAQEVAELASASLSDDDLRTLRFGTFLDGLKRGVAAHHAGMLPAFKECVELLFAEGVIKVVFATETLALGINMPARTVVLERLSKFTGERHELLTPLDYTQLTGRAGRRGIDTIGYGVVCFDPGVNIDQVSRIATSTSYPLSSSFRLSYNIAANLVATRDRADAEEILGSSFAQYLSDRSVVKAERRLAALNDEIKAIESQLVCEHGDLAEYLKLVSDLESAREPASGGGSSDATSAVDSLKPGDIIDARGLGQAIVLETPRRTGSGPSRLTVMTRDRKLRRMSARDFRSIPVTLGRIKLGGQGWRSPKTRRTLWIAVERLKLPRYADRVDRDEVRQFQSAVDKHPVSQCADLKKHLKQGTELRRLHAARATATHKVRKRKSNLVRSLDAIVGVMTETGFAEGWELTGAGEMLRRVYNQADLVVVNAVTRGWFAELDPAHLVAAASCFTFETRTGTEPATLPDPAFRAWVRKVSDLASSIQVTESRYNLELTSDVDPGFSAVAYDWARQASFEEALRDTEFSAGDFVRAMRQVVDLLRQIRGIADPALREKINMAIESVHRGVIRNDSLD